MTKTTTIPKSRRVAKIAAPNTSPTKLGLMVALLRRPDGVTIDELVSGTSWQKHSVRGAIAGTLKKKGHVISSEMVDGTRRYRITETQA